jgi:hypothetical protein
MSMNWCIAMVARVLRIAHTTRDPVNQKSESTDPMIRAGGQLGASRSSTRSRNRAQAPRTLLSVLDALEREGFTEHFAVRGDRLVGLESGSEFAAGEVVIRCVERFEGISDPDDMSIVYAIEGRTGVRGTLSDAFGVYSNPVVSDFMDKVECQPQEDRGS